MGQVERYKSYARLQATLAGIDPEIFCKQINVESGWNPHAGSSAGAVGIAQIVPRWHPDVNPWNPWESLHYAAQIMGEYHKEYGLDPVLPLVRYNGGGGAVKAWLDGEPYDESVLYVKWILG